MKRILFLGAFSLLLSCNNEEREILDTQQIEFTVKKDVNLDLKKKFSIALAKVLAENQDVRSLIKNEALKKINYDYDVLYQLIKDEKLDDGSTLESNLLKYIEASELASINKQIPTLTIFVPDLGNDVFSAELWDITLTIPEVGIRTCETNDVPIYNAIGDEFILGGVHIPQFPVIVVKENERIVVANGNSNLKTSKVLSTRSSSVTQFAFIDDVFNNTTNDKFSDTKPTTRSIDGSTYSNPTMPNEINKTLEAYDKYLNKDGWHRDYIYYNITPTSAKGPFSLQYKEHLVGFEMVGDPAYALNKIADQTGDPKLNNSTGTRFPGWTDGEFEFQVKVYVGSKSAVGNEIITNFRAAPTDLFSPIYKESAQSGRTTRVYAGLVPIKKIISLPLFEWDLENYGSTIKISIEEVDATETSVTATSTTVEFATNFEYNIAAGEKVKQGFKFGASAKESRTVSFTKTITQANDVLGEVVINFGDNIISDRSLEVISEGIRPNDKYYYYPNYNNKYSTGWYRLYIAPKKVN